MDKHTPSDWEAPDWAQEERLSRGNNPHDWRKYIPDEMRAVWDDFTPEQKQMIARMADDIASQEHWN